VSQGLGGVFSGNRPRLGAGALRRFFARFDWILFVSILTLCAIGLANLHSATYSTAHSAKFDQQLVWFLVGFAVFVALSAVDYQGWYRLSWAGLIGVLGLIAYVRLFTVAIKGSQRWLTIGSFARVQPSELAKIAVILALARLLHDQATGETSTRRRLVGVVLLAAPVVMVALQPDLGTAILLALILASTGLMLVREIVPILRAAAIGLLITAAAILATKLGLPTGVAIGAGAVLTIGAVVVLRDGLPLAASAAFGALPLVWHRMEAYQQGRIMCFLDPQIDPTGRCYHILQSLNAVGSGRFSGKGYVNATQNRLNFLPEHWTDFPFSVWAEEWGFVGSVALIAVFGFLILWILKVAARAKDLFGTAICIGVAAMVFWHVVVNISMVLSLAPVVGVTLPLISYGGSSILTFFVGLGLVASVSARSQT
jgi:rod shape determining protein RodA